MSDKVDPELVKFILRDMNDRALDLLMVIRNRQKDHDKMHVMDDAIRLMEMKCRGIENKESWYKVTDKRCPVVEGQIIITESEWMLQ